MVAASIILCVSANHQASTDCPKPTAYVGVSSAAYQGAALVPKAHLRYAVRLRPWDNRAVHAWT